MTVVEQIQKLTPFNTCEISLGRYVSELVLGVSAFDFDLGVQIDSIKQPIKSNSLGSGNMSHCGTPPFKEHLDQCKVVFKIVLHSFPYEKNSRLKKRNQHCLDHQSFHEISFALEIYKGLPVLDHSDACFREEL